MTESTFKKYGVLIPVRFKGMTVVDKESSVWCLDGKQLVCTVNKTTGTVQSVPAIRLVDDNGDERTLVHRTASKVEARRWLSKQSKFHILKDGLLSEDYAARAWAPQALNFPRQLLVKLAHKGSFAWDADVLGELPALPDETQAS